MADQAMDTEVNMEVCLLSFFTFHCFVGKKPKYGSENWESMSKDDWEQWDKDESKFSRKPTHYFSKHGGKGKGRGLINTDLPKS